METSEGAYIEGEIEGGSRLETHPGPAATEIKNNLEGSELKTYKKGEIEISRLTKKTLLTLIGRTNEGNNIDSGFRFSEGVEIVSTPSFEGRSLTDIITSDLDGSVDVEAEEQKYKITLLLSGMKLSEGDDVTIYTIKIIPTERLFENTKLWENYLGLVAKHLSKAGV